jgi:S-adenosylmethionine:tRNA ribosyltransferase-isomerase
VSPLSPRWIEIDLGRDAWHLIYSLGRPVQYAHRPELMPLWSVQTAYAGRPWAVEMPSAGRALTWDQLLALRRRGVTIAAVTHAAGLSSTGDPAIDAALPLPERYELPAATVAAIAAARRRGGRVIAIGTTVMRALESAALGGDLRPGPGIAELVITADFRPRVVDGLVSGIHGPAESHYRVLASLIDGDTLAAATAQATIERYQPHELGDACVILPGALPDRQRQPRGKSPATPRCSEIKYA